MSLENGKHILFMGGNEELVVFGRGTSRVCGVAVAVFLVVGVTSVATASMLRGRWTATNCLVIVAELGNNMLSESPPVSHALNSQRDIRGTDCNAGARFYCISFGIPCVTES